METLIFNSYSYFEYLSTEITPQFVEKKFGNIRSVLNMEFVHKSCF